MKKIMVMALALLVGIGSAANFNLNLGAGKREPASFFAGNAITLLAGGGAAFQVGEVCAVLLGVSGRVFF